MRKKEAPGRSRSAAKPVFRAASEPVSRFDPVGLAAKRQEAIGILLPGPDRDTTTLADVAALIEGSACLYNALRYADRGAPRLADAKKKLTELRAASEHLARNIRNIDDVTADYLFGLPSDPVYGGSWRDINLSDPHADASFAEAFRQVVGPRDLLPPPAGGLLSSGAPILLNAVGKKIAALISLIDRASSDLSSLGVDRGGKVHLAYLRLGSPVDYLTTQCLEMLDEHRSDLPPPTGTWTLGNPQPAQRLIEAIHEYATGEDVTDAMRKAYLAALKSKRDFDARFRARFSAE